MRSTRGDMPRVHASRGSKSEAMMRLRRASAIVALSLLTSAATACADGDWVLWTPPARSADMSAIAIAVGSFQTREECEAEKQTRE
jgi:hypothetical protein